MEIQGEPLSQEFLKFPGQSTWTSGNKLFKLLFFYTSILTWNAFLAVLELLTVFTTNFYHIFVYMSNYTQLEVRRHFLSFLKHVIGGRTSHNINSEPCTGVHVNFLQQIWVFYIVQTSMLFQIELHIFIF